MTLSRNISLRVLIPTLIAFAGVVDVGARFLPIQWFSFRAWEASLRYPTGPGPFTPNFQYSNPHSHGDLPNLGNQPALAIRRHDQFSADDAGFRRNGTAFEKDVPAVMVLGDSFIVGASLNDDETLSAQLEQALHRRVLNAGRMKITGTRILAEAKRRNMQGGVILFESLEGGELPTVDEADFRGFKEQTLNRRVRRFTDKIWQGFWQITPVEIMAQRLWKRLQHDQFFPNPYRKDIFSGTLVNGQTMSFRALDAQFVAESGARDISGLIQLQKILADANFRLAVLLLPAKYRVYGPLVTSRQYEPSSNPRISKVEDNLIAAQIPVVNPSRVLVEGAPRYLNQGQLLYWLDDSHWTPLGVKLAVDQLKPVMDRLLQ